MADIAEHHEAISDAPDQQQGKRDADVGVGRIKMAFIGRFKSGQAQSDQTQQHARQQAAAKTQQQMRVVQ